MPEGSLRDGTGEGANGSASEILRLPGRGAHGCALGRGRGPMGTDFTFQHIFPHAGRKGAHRVRVTAQTVLTEGPQGMERLSKLTRKLLSSKEGLNNPHLGRNAIGCGSKIRFEDLSER